MAYKFKTVTDYTGIAKARAAQIASTNASITDATRAVATNAVERNVKKEFPDDPYGQEALKFRITRLQGANPVGADMYRKMLDDLQSTEAVARKAQEKTFRDANKKNFSTPINAQVLDPETDKFSTQSVVLDKNNNQYYYAGDMGGKPIPASQIQAITGRTSSEFPKVREITPALQLEARKTIEQITDFPGGLTGFSSKIKKNLTRQLIEYAATREARDKGNDIPPQSFTNYVLQGYDLLKNDPNVFADRQIGKGKFRPDYNLGAANQVLTTALGDKQEKQAMPTEDSVINDIKIIQFLGNKTEAELLEIYGKGDDNMKKIIRNFADKKRGSN